MSASGSSSGASERAQYIEALPAPKRERIHTRMRRGDTLNTILSVVEDHPVPNARVQAEMVKFLEHERNEAYEEQRNLERRFGVPEVGVPELD